MIVAIVAVICGAGVLIARARAPVSHSDWLHPPAKTYEDATITAVDRDAKTVTARVVVDDGKLCKTIVASVAGAEPTHIVLDGKPARQCDLRPGMRARLRVRGNVAEEIDARSAGDESEKGKGQ
jgi:hypothetical protein